MPVIKVNFFIETANNPSDLGLESLLLEVWTNGSLMPDEALKLSSEILENTFNLLKESNIKKMSVDPETCPQNNNSNRVLIEDLELSSRPYRCLIEAKIETLDDLLKYSAKELLELNNFGKRSLIEVCNKLQTKFNLKLRGFHKSF